MARNSSGIGSDGQCFGGVVSYCIAAQAASGLVDLPEKTPYWQATPRLDEQGLPFSEVPDGSRFRNVSSVAFAMLSRDTRSFDDACAAYHPDEKARAALAFFERNAVEAGGGAVVWRYDYDTQINDVLLKAPWASAFGQAAAIERLLIHSCKTGEAGFAELARRAGKAFFLPVTLGGLRSENDQFVWFQEVPIPDRHNPFIVNAHLYSIRTLLLLDRHFPGEGFRLLAERGLQSFRSALSVIDNGYWNRYDLRPRYMAVNFQISGHGTLSRAEMHDGDVSEIDFGTRRRSPKANFFERKPGQQLTRDGLVLSERPILISFSTRHGREFDPKHLRDALDLRFTFAGDGDIQASSLGGRPGDIEFFRLAKGTKGAAGSDATVDFSVSLGDLGWGQVAPEYLPFHAATLASIARSIGDPQLFLRALRWQIFADRHADRSPSDGPRRRWHWTENPDLAAAVWEKFGTLRPEDIDESDIRLLVLSLPMSASDQAAAFETLPIEVED
ncbi:D-glucuronyl C5-epimerase family protein [Bosea sp. LC85]|uniref:D-glucuronyl C5-epimerase family protein n=1 Tax=Bosea sp. LC85 TaxID=1502851 RepID=UPI001378B1B6|nr:D-glucuronyl C5-epimerase family protein [Bosea sp. LC85]